MAATTRENKNERTYCPNESNSYFTRLQPEIEWESFCIQSIYLTILGCRVYSVELCVTHLIEHFKFRTVCVCLPGCSFFPFGLTLIRCSSSSSSFMMIMICMHALWCPTTFKCARSRSHMGFLIRNISLSSFTCLLFPISFGLLK